MAENERLTIDEIIQHCNRHTERMEQTSSRMQLEETPIGNSDRMKQYWEHRQVAEWLEEIQQYRAIGTVEQFEQLSKQFAPHNVDETSCHLRQCNKCDMYRKENEKYHAIGTIDEFKALKEKNEPIANGEWIDTQPGYNNGYYKNVRVCSNCHDYYTTEYDEMKFCPKCGAKMKEQD